MTARSRSRWRAGRRPGHARHCPLDDRPDHARDGALGGGELGRARAGGADARAVPAPEGAVGEGVDLLEPALVDMFFHLRAGARDDGLVMPAMGRWMTGPITLAMARWMTGPITLAMARW